MGRLPPTRKHRKPVRGIEPVLPAAGKGKLGVPQETPGPGKPPRAPRPPACDVPAAGEAYPWAAACRAL